MVTALKTERNVGDVMDTDGDEGRCCLCMDDITVWAIGSCKHPVCYICSSRMRTLGERQITCAICKTSMDKVVFHDSYFDYDTIKVDSLKKLDEFGIHFLNDDSLKLYNELRKERCSICSDFSAANFPELKRHMSKKHNLHSCDLCVDNYLLFPGERKWYTRSDLATHKRKGDPDDKSHKGHPECEFCRERFLDDHELYKHLRKKHFLCHICEMDDGSRDFIDTINDLVRHYKRKHFYCEHMECQESPMESVFRSELDLKIHAAEKHGVGDKKSLRIDVGSTHRDHSRRQIEIEEEINEMVNQPRPNVQDQESFPSLGDKKGNAPFGGQASQKKSQAQTTYRSLSSKNINSNEDFPSLGGSISAPMQRQPANWNSKAKQNNKQITKPKKKALPTRTSTYIPSNPASALAAPDPGTSSWSAEPDKFVEKSQLQLQAEREAAKREAAKTSKSNSAPKKQDFPSLGAATPSSPAAFWGVPGAAIKKSANTGKKKKVISAGNPKVNISNKKTKVSSSIPNTVQPISSTKKAKETVVIPQQNYNPNSASDTVQRMSGGNSEWSAPPEVFHERSLLEIEEERRKDQNKHKKQSKPKEQDFPTLGGTSKSTENAFWGIPGNSIPKSNSGKSKKIQKPKLPVAQTRIQSPPKPEPVIKESLAFTKKEKQAVQKPSITANESQQASILAQRMTGGSSGWSAPPDVFKEKSLLEIEEEKRQRKSQNKSKKSAPKMNESSFPSLGGGMSEETRVGMAFEFRATKTYNKKFQSDTPSPITPESGSAANILKQRILNEEKKKKEAKKKKQTKIMKKIEEVRHIDVSSDDDEFVDAIENFDDINSPPKTEMVCQEEEESEEDDMMAINQRLMAAMREMDHENQQTFKISSGRYRTGAINAEEYIELGCILMGKLTFLRILPDLIKTLPDGKHKQALAYAKAP